MKIESAAVYFSEFRCSGAVVTYCVHDKCVMSPVNLGTREIYEFNFCECELEEATNANKPTVFEVVQGFCGVFKDRITGACLLLNLDKVYTDLSAKFSVVEKVAAQHVDSLLALYKY